MMRVFEFEDALTPDERNMFAVAFKGRLDAARLAWRSLSTVADSASASSSDKASASSTERAKA